MTYADMWNGDSRELVKRFKPESIQSIITDPPFGVNNLSNMATTEAGKKHARKIAGDESPEEALLLFNTVILNLMPAMKAESDIYIFTSYQVLEEWLTATRELLAPYGYTRKALLVWQKDGPGMGDLNSWGMGCEFVLYYKRGSRPSSDTRRNNVLAVPQLRPGELIHPHEKPTGLLELLIKHSTSKGDWVVDPFAGSGSTVRAARNLGRNSIGIEYDEYNFIEAKKKLDNEAGGFDFS